MLIFRAGIHKKVVGIANKEDPLQSELSLHCLSRSFCRQLVFEILEHKFTIDFGIPDKWGVIPKICFVSQPNHMLWVLKRTVPVRRKNMFRLMHKKIITVLYTKYLFTWTWLLVFLFL